MFSGITKKSRTRNEEIDLFLIEIRDWDDGTQIYRYPQILLNITDNRNDPFTHIRLDQPPDQSLGNNKCLGPSILEKYLQIGNNKIRFNETVKSLKEFLERNREK